MNWNNLETHPPDELVEVIDEYGNTGYAYPTYYPFIVEPNPDKVGKWTSDIIQCEPYWDGGWMIKCDGLDTKINSVVGWKLIENEIKI